MKSTKQVEQPIHYSPEDEVKIRKYGRIEKILFSVGLLGFATGMYFGICGPGIHLALNRPGIVREHTLAQNMISELKKRGKLLEDALSKENVSNRNGIIRDLEAYSEDLEYHQAFKDYMEKEDNIVKSQVRYGFTGTAMFGVGMIGGLLANKRKDKLKRKYKKQK